MTNRELLTHAPSYAPQFPKSEVEFLHQKIENLERELSDLTFEFKQCMRELARN